MSLISSLEYDFLFSVTVDSIKTGRECLRRTDFNPDKEPDHADASNPGLGRDGGADDNRNRNDQRERENVDEISSDDAEVENFLVKLADPVDTGLVRVETKLGGRVGPVELPTADAGVVHPALFVGFASGPGSWTGSGTTSTGRWPDVVEWDIDLCVVWRHDSGRGRSVW